MIIGGFAYFGTVDRVPGLFYVKTRFFQVWWIPLFPTESWVVADHNGNRGQRIRLSTKSVLVACSRVTIGFLFVLMGLTLMPILEPNLWRITVHPIVVAGIILTMLVVLPGAYALIFRWAKPNEHRAFQIATWMGIDPSEVANRFPPSQGIKISGSGTDL